MFIRHPSEIYHACSEYDIYVSLEESILNLLSCEKSVDANREKVSVVMYKQISQMTSPTQINLCRKWRRKMYHNLDCMYPISAFSLPESDPVDIDFLKLDLFYRQKYVEAISIASNCMKTAERSVEENIKAHCNNSEFISKLYIANRDFAQIVTSSGPLRNSHYMTLLRYIYKQETCCTPSSLWSGISYAGPLYNFDFAYITDLDRTKIKFEHRSEVLKALSLPDEDWKSFSVFVNLTLFLSDGMYYMYQFFRSTVSKIRIKKNPILDFLYDNFRYRVFTLSELSNRSNDFTNQVIYSLLELDILRVENPLSYGQSGITFFTILPEKNEYDNINIRYPNLITDPDIILSLSNDANMALEIYRQMINSFYAGTYWGSTYASLKDFLEKHGRISLLAFLYSPFADVNTNKPNKRQNREWKIPTSKSGRERYDHFIFRIKERLSINPNMHTLRFDIKDLNDIFQTSINAGKDEFEIVYQYDYSQNCVIPEMLSATVGRFLGRYTKYFPEISNTIYKEIYNSAQTQINIDINSTKDNISYNNPYSRKRMVLYELDNATVMSCDDLLHMGNVYLDIEKDEIILCDNSGKRIFPNCASSLSPGSSQIYRLLCHMTNINSAKAPFGGTCHTRLELNLDYQPRIVIGNLLISRRRWRIRKQEFSSVFSEKAKLLDILLWKARKSIPEEFYIYTDAHSKPSYARLGTKYDVLLFKRTCSDAKEYIYIEEVYPNYLSNMNFSEYNLEVLDKICLT